MGRPGWHIECSVMASTYLGDTIDIHGGGQDLIFPHHENEIAQSQAKSGLCFVRYWMHNGFVTINQEKMSKSLGNFFTLDDIFAKYEPRVIRYYLISQHYRSPLDFSDVNIDSAKNALQGLDDVYLRLLQAGIKENAEISDKDLLEIEAGFLESLDDDFNSQKALSFLHKLKIMIAAEIFTKDAGRLKQMKHLFESMLDESLGIIMPTSKKDENAEEILEQRNLARKAKDWKKADALRAKLDDMGYKIVDNPDGSSSLTKKIK
jgi:cysteinyl-tRNA synthetase